MLKGPVSQYPQLQECQTVQIWIQRDLLDPTALWYYHTKCGSGHAMTTQSLDWLCEAGISGKLSHFLSKYGQPLHRIFWIYLLKRKYLYFHWNILMDEWYLKCISSETLNRHTFWSCLIRCINMKWIYEMDLTRTVGAKEQTRDAGRTDGWTEGQMDRWTNGWTDGVKPIYPQQLCCAGGGGYNKNTKKWGHPLSWLLLHFSLQ